MDDHSILNSLLVHGFQLPRGQCVIGWVFNKMYNSTNCYIKRKWEIIVQDNGSNNELSNWFDLDKIGQPKIDWDKRVEDSKD